MSNWQAYDPAAALQKLGVNNPLHVRARGGKEVVATINQHAQPLDENGRLIGFEPVEMRYLEPEKVPAAKPAPPRKD